MVSIEDVWRYLTTAFSVEQSDDEQELGVKNVKRYLNQLKVNMERPLDEGLPRQPQVPAEHIERTMSLLRMFAHQVMQVESTQGSISPRGRELKEACLVTLRELEGERT